MKEKYIKQLKKALKPPAHKKKEVLRDVCEAFDSAQEHGETAQQVIARLGSPQDFAAGWHEQWGLNPQSLKKRRLRLTALLLGLIVLGALALRLYIRRQETMNIIGGADGMTSIIVSSNGLGLAPILLCAAVILAAVALGLLIKSFRTGNR